MIFDSSFRKVREHSGRIMAVLRLFIDNIEDISTVTTQLEKLGQVSNVNLQTIRGHEIYRFVSLSTWN